MFPQCVHRMGVVHITLFMIQLILKNTRRRHSPPSIWCILSVIHTYAVHHHTLILITPGVHTRLHSATTSLRSVFTVQFMFSASLWSFILTISVLQVTQTASSTGYVSSQMITFIHKMTYINDKYKRAPTSVGGTSSFGFCQLLSHCYNPTGWVLRQQKDFVGALWAAFTCYMFTWGWHLMLANFTLQ